MTADSACDPPPDREPPLEDLFAPSPRDPEDMPGDPRDRRDELAFWRARGVRPSWAGRVDADRPVSRAELARVSRHAAKGDAALEDLIFRLAAEVARLKQTRGGR